MRIEDYREYEEELDNGMILQARFAVNIDGVIFPGFELHQGWDKTEIVPPYIVRFANDEARLRFKLRCLDGIEKVIDDLDCE